MTSSTETKDKPRIAVLAATAALEQMLGPFVQSIILDSPFTARLFAPPHSWWTRLDLSDVLDYQPDRVLIWNCKLPDCRLATAYFASNSYAVYELERGWLPQQNTWRCSPTFVGELNFGDYFSRIADTPRYRQELKDRIEQAATPPVPSIPRPNREYILAIGQLANDSNAGPHDGYIPTYADFCSAVSALGRVSPYPVVFSPHPLEEAPSHPPFTTFPPSGIPTLSLIPHAKMVLAYSSTMIFESLLHGKQPVICGPLQMHPSFSPSGASLLNLLKHLYLVGESERKTCFDLWLSARSHFECDRATGDAFHTLRSAVSWQFPAGKYCDWLKTILRLA